MNQGSGWANVIDSGVFIRGMDDDPVSLVNVVASSNMKNSHSYTDWNDVDEDMVTITNQGGTFPNETGNGMFQRHVDSVTHATVSSVAPVCEHHLLYLVGYHNVGHKIPTDQSIRMYLYLYKFS